jgi:hypothetical protein
MRSPRKRRFADEFQVVMMGFGRSRRAFSRRRWLAAALALVAVASTGCTSQLADLAEPAETPPRPAAAPAYPAVHDMPAPRDTSPLTEAERQRISDELSALREKVRRAQECTTVHKEPCAD